MTGSSRRRRPVSSNWYERARLAPQIGDLYVCPGCKGSGGGGGSPVGTKPGAKQALLQPATGAGRQASDRLKAGGRRRKAQTDGSDFGGQTDAETDCASLERLQL